MSPSEAIAKLRAAGWSEAAIAAAVKSTQSTINRIHRGEIDDPKFSVGRALVDLADALPAVADEPHELPKAA